MIFFYIMFALITIFVLGMIVCAMIDIINTRRKDNQSPRLTVDAKVVSKRPKYFVTFEVESGDRMELCVSGQEYGMLVEGDHGILNFQGTRYLSFEREVTIHS